MKLKPQDIQDVEDSLFHVLEWLSKINLWENIDGVVLPVIWAVVMLWDAVDEY